MVGLGQIGFDDLSQAFDQRFDLSPAFFDFDDISANWAIAAPPTPIPLPAPFLLLVAALAGLFGVSRFKRKAVVAA